MIESFLFVPEAGFNLGSTPYYSVWFASIVSCSLDHAVFTFAVCVLFGLLRWVATFELHFNGRLSSR